MSQDFLNLKGQLHRARQRICSLEISLGKEADMIIDLCAQIETLKAENSDLRARLERTHPAEVEP